MSDIHIIYGDMGVHWVHTLKCTLFLLQLCLPWWIEVYSCLYNLQVDESVCAYIDNTKEHHIVILPTYLQGFSPIY